MASSGSLLTNGWYSDSKGDYVYLEFAWSVTATSIPNNTTTIYWELRGKRTASGFVNAGGFRVVIDGETVYDKSTDYRIELRNGTVVASGSKTIAHNADGTRSFSVSIQGGIYTFAVNATGSKAFTLDTIPRASSISCTVANIESKPTITISRASSSFTHTITYHFGTLTGTIVSRTSATSITNWTIPAVFYGQIPNAKTGRGTLTCTTYSGTTPIGTSTCNLDVTTDEAKCKPTVSGTVEDVNPVTVALTGNKNTLVRYCSTAQCTIAVTLNKNAGSIKSKTINNVSVSGTTLTIAAVETGVFDFYAKDSREYPGTDKEVKTLIPYEKLTNNAMIQRTEPTSGKATLTFEGNYFNGSFGATSNALTVKYRQGSGSYVSVTPTISGNKYTATVSLSGLDYTQSFTYEVVVSDKISTVTKKLTLQKGVPVFDWGEEDFNFNVPVSFTAEDGSKFIISPDGTATAQGAKGDKGDPGADGMSPYIGGDGNWWVWDAEKSAYVDTLVTAGYDELNRKNLAAIANMTEATETLDISAYEKGSITTGGVDGTYRQGSRARTIGIHTADSDKTLYSANGVAGICAFFFDEDGNYESVTDWLDTLEIPAGTNYRLILSLDPKAASTVVNDLSEILANFYFVSEYKIVKQVEDIAKALDVSVNPYGERINLNNYAELLPSMDAAVPNKIYSVLKTSSCAIENYPDAGSSSFVTFAPESGETFKVQMMFCVESNKVMVRTCVSGAWNPWSTLVTSEDIAEALSVSINPYGTRITASNFADLLPDMDDALPNKIYSVYRTSACTIGHWPNGVTTATFVTLTPEIGDGKNTYKVQLLFNIANNTALVRTNVSNTWQAWTPLGSSGESGAGVAGITLYVSTNGNDGADGSAAYPLATFSEAISRGANTIIAEPGTYAQTISAIGVNNLTIRPNKKKYDGSFQDGLNPKIILNNSRKLYPYDFGWPGGCYWADDIQLDTNSRIYKVFVSRELPILDDSGSEADGYNANAFVRLADGEYIKLKPVETYDECVETANSFTVWDDEEYGHCLFINCSSYDEESTLNFVEIPTDEDIIANFDSCDNLVLEDIQTEYGWTYGINIQNCRNATITACNAHCCTNGEGIRLDYTNAKLTYCKAYHNRNDGLNMHQNGYTELVDCQAKYNGDDGVSHHQGCSGTIIGGEYSYNGSGGITPAFGAEVNVYNAIMRGNLYGLQVLGASGYASRTMIAMNNIMTENIKGGLYVKKNTVVGMNTIHGNDENQIVLGTGGAYVNLSANA